MIYITFNTGDHLELTVDGQRFNGIHRVVLRDRETSMDALHRVSYNFKQKDLAAKSALYEGLVNDAIMVLMQRGNQGGSPSHIATFTGLMFTDFSIRLEEDSWMPIEYAPKNKRILVFDPAWRDAGINGGVTEAKWNDALDDGFWDAGGGGRPNPTHWQYFPKGPMI